jgi:type II secretory pathway pseudopilin PulG
VTLRGGAFGVVVAALIGAGCAAAPLGQSDAIRQRGLEAAQAYARAIERLDDGALTRMSHPILILREGDAEQFRRGQTQFLTFLKAAGWPETGSERLGEPSAPFVDGKTLMVGVPAIRKVPGTADTPFVYVSTSYDGGGTWSVLMLGCTDEHWLKGLAPGYQGVPDILGKENPAIASYEATGTFDDAVFLRGTHWSE